MLSEESSLQLYPLRETQSVSENSWVSSRNLWKCSSKVLDDAFDMQIGGITTIVVIFLLS